MSPQQQEIHDLAFQTPFVSFTLVTSSGERIRVPTGDHIKFSPNTDESGKPLPDDQRAQSFIVYGAGSRHRIIFFQSVSHIDFAADTAERE